MHQDQAVAVALQALAFIAADEDALVAMMAQSGLSAADLRARASDPALLGGVLDFLLADEQRLLAFCEARSLDARLPARARQALPGAPSES